jgi:hypothetical protein
LIRHDESPAVTPGFFARRKAVDGKTLAAALKTLREMFAE